MQFQNHNDYLLYQKIYPLLLNIKVKSDSISMFCPFCQIDGCKTSDKRWSQSQRKGYIIHNHSKGYDYAIFYCHNTNCRSHSLSQGSGGISLSVLADHVLGTAQRSPAVSLGSHPCMGTGSKSSSHTGRNSTDPAVIVLPPSNRNQQSGLGAALDRKVKNRKSRHRNQYL